MGTAVTAADRPQIDHPEDYIAFSGDGVHRELTAIFRGWRSSGSDRRSPRHSRFVMDPAIRSSDCPDDQRAAGNRSINWPEDGSFIAVQGGGAYRSQRQRTRLRVSTEADPARMCLVASRSHYSEFIDAARQVLGIATVNRVGSVGLKVGLVARAECDLYLATTISKEWDICAPHAILVEAGGALTNLCGEAL
jgi:hypothetical protein